MEKVIRLGTVKIGEHARSVFCEIKVKDGRLSITGVEGPKANGNALGSCGQIVMHLKASDICPVPGDWTRGKINKFLGIWERWHLNDMTAGSPAQEQWLRDHEFTVTYPESHYEVASDQLAAAGLNPDESYLHNGEPYKYGHAWLKEEVPAGVIEWLSQLPNTDKKPAWV